jgi:outer membrane biosynthesis protein TonB
MNDKLNKTSICSVLALEMIDFSKKSEAEQIDIKALFDGFINQAVIDIPQEDRVIIDTSGGVMIACSGPQEDALEDALFISITIRDEILKHNAHGATPLYVRFGIHLGAVREVKKALVGVGIDEAQRIMSFAEPNQILVSQAYFEMASKLTQEMAQMFEKYEMHAHEHDIYAVRMLKEAVKDESPSIPTDIAEPEVDATQTIANKINLNYVGLGFLVLAAFFVLGKLVSSPTEPTITMDPPVVLETPTKPEAEPTVAAKPTEETKPAEDKAKAIEAKKEAEIKQEEPKKAKVTQKKPQKKTTVEAEAPASKPEKAAESKSEKPAESKSEKATTSEKSSWETVKESVSSGAERKCSQAEIAMNQCK